MAKKNLKNRKEHILLQNANVTQLTNSGKKSEWTLKANITGKILGTLPSRLIEKEIFSILDMSRKYELEAFNVGIEFGKEKERKHYQQKLLQLEERLKLAINENERLAEALDTATSK